MMISYRIIYNDVIYKFMTYILEVIYIEIYMFMSYMLGKTGNFPTKTEL